MIWWESMNWLIKDICSNEKDEDYIKSKVTSSWPTHRPSHGLGHGSGHDPSLCRNGLTRFTSNRQRDTQSGSKVQQSSHSPWKCTLVSKSSETGTETDTTALNTSRSMQEVITQISSDNRHRPHQGLHTRYVLVTRIRQTRSTKIKVLGYLQEQIIHKHNIVKWSAV